MLNNTTDGMVEDGFSNEQTMGINVIFVVSGVLSGLVVGRVVPDRPGPQALAVRCLFVLAAASLLGVQLLLLHADKMSKGTLYALVMMMMCLAGSGTLGFIGVGLRVAVGYSHPAEEIYAGSIIEFFLLGIASALGLLTYVVPPNATFWFFAIPACIAAVVICSPCVRFYPQSDPPASLHDTLLSCSTTHEVSSSPSAKRTSG